MRGIIDSKEAHRPAPRATPWSGVSLMTGLIGTVRRWLYDDQGVTAVEYAIMLALIIVALISTISAVGGTALNIFENDAAQINAAMGG